jgi:hypothetical protein
MDEKPDEKAGKCVVSLWLDPAIRDALDEKARGIERSRSWMASLIFKQALGLIPDEDKKS